MALADAGFEIEIYDRLAAPLAAASSHNEGKIHLGYVYANDPSLRTARLMVRGALSFERLLRRWIGSDVERIPVSSPFHYAVHKDSLVDPEGVERHFRSCHEILLDETGSAAPEYFGQDPRNAPRRLRDHDHLFAVSEIPAAYATREVAIDAMALGDVLRRHLAALPRTRLVMAATVTGVEMADGSIGVNFEQDGRSFQERYAHVINALWDGRLAVDATAGLYPERPWLFRRRQFLRGRADGADASTIPCATIIVGPLGDLARFGNDVVHLSWYPAGMTAISRALAPPAWCGLCRPEQEAQVRAGTITALQGIIPALRTLFPGLATTIECGVVVAWGATGLEDAHSALHTRSDVGVISRGRYHSIDTGKLTTAPLFAAEVAARIRSS